jgi:hypothetical protein
MLPRLNFSERTTKRSRILVMERARKAISRVTPYQQRWFFQSEHRNERSGYAPFLGVKFFPEMARACSSFLPAERTGLIDSWFSIDLLGQLSRRCAGSILPMFSLTKGSPSIACMGRYGKMRESGPDYRMSAFMT